MATYDVQHLLSEETFTRQEILIHQPSHESSETRSWESTKVDSAIESFHKSLPDYAETKLHELPSVASELGLPHVFIKDESTRFGLPAFKILGASWAIHRVICERLSFPITSSLEEVRRGLANHRKNGNELKIVTCTEGNWGRACARMAKYLQMPATIYVPQFMSEYTRHLVRGEGAELIVLNGSYDDTITAVQEDARKTGSLMVMDVSWDGYEEIPQWVTDGYRTMVFETDRQVASIIGETKPNTFFVSVGVGSWAHAVVSHYKGQNRENHIISVEPTAAACLKESLHCGRNVPVETGETIMAGMCCGTVSKIAWPVLQDGIHAAVTVNDQESHENVEYLQKKEVNAGPCGAATLAALRKYVKNVDEKTRARMIVVLFSTEGWRKYEIPH